MRGASPRLGALGLATLLLFSWPAFEGKVGNIADDFGRGFSWKKGCARTSEAVGLSLGLRLSRDVRSDVPALVRRGNLARMTEPVV